jgi:hypothetical protein
MKKAAAAATAFPELLAKEAYSFGIGMAGSEPALAFIWPCTAGGSGIRPRP